MLFRSFVGTIGNLLAVLPVVMFSVSHGVTCHKNSRGSCAGDIVSVCPMVNYGPFLKISAITMGHGCFPGVITEIFRNG